MSGILSRVRLSAALGVLGGLTVLALVVGNGNPAVALAPALGVLLLLALRVLPLRVPLLVLFAASLVLEVPGDAFAGGRVQTPWHIAGALLFAKLNLTVPVNALVVSGYDLLTLCFLVLIAVRHARRSRLDRPASWVRAPAPLTEAALISLLAVLFILTLGLARGGTFRYALWQVSKHLYLPITVLLFAEALRGPADLPVLGRILLGAGAFRALEAVVVRRMFPSLEEMPHATTHHDSVLFAVCAAVLLAMLLEKPSRKAMRLTLLLGPLYLAGMFANNRRLVWTELAAIAAFCLLVTPLGRVKRSLVRALAAAAIPGAIYLAMGWSSGGGRTYAPVRMVRSLVDSNVDTSRRWRDYENYDLVFTYRQNPLLGSGFGHPYIDVARMANVTQVYDLEPYVPHNSVLGLWAFGGLVGFSLLWVIYPVGFFFVMRAYRCAQTPAERIAALTAGAAEIGYLMQAYGDLGFGTWGPMFLLAASFAVTGKICVLNGGWSTQLRSAPVKRAEPTQWQPGVAP